MLFLAQRDGKRAGTSNQIADMMLRGYDTGNRGHVTAVRACNTVHRVDVTARQRARSEERERVTARRRARIEVREADILLPRS